MHQAGRQRGITFIELVITIVILAVGLTGTLLLYQRTGQSSADPMLHQQALAIGESYLEEILLRAYSDPNADETGETRTTYDDVDDYDGLSDSGARDQSDNPVSGLESYTVTVEVSTVNIGPTGNTTPAHKVDVTVGHGNFSDINVHLSGYRSNYP